MDRWSEIKYKKVIKTTKYDLYKILCKVNKEKMHFYKTF